VPSRPRCKLAALIRQYVDRDRLLADHPQVTAGQLDAFWRQCGAPEEPSQDLFDAPEEAPPPPKRPQRAGEHLPLVARCDGASRGNPGPAAVGVVIEDQDGQDLMDFGEAIGETTNNVAEYRAVIRAAEKGLELGGTELHLKLDSQLLARQLQGRYRVKAAHLKPLHRQATALLERFQQWDVQFVPREQNAAADRLANQALDRQRRQQERKGGR
jgi:ribonuclease HI